MEGLDKVRGKPRCPPSGYINQNGRQLQFIQALDLDDFTGNWGTVNSLLSM